MEKFFHLAPGSEIAKTQGCTCVTDSIGDYQINKRCPLHWQLYLLITTENIYAYTLNQDKKITFMIGGLIFLCIFTIILQILYA